MTDTAAVRDATRVLKLRQKKRRQRRLRLAGVAALVLVAAGLIAWLIAFSPVFAADAVEVTGAAEFSPSDAQAAAVVAAADVPLGQPLVRLDTAAIAARVETLDWVDAATVTRHLGGTVEIAVTPRGAVYALAQDGGYALVDAAGHAFETSSELPAGLLAVTMPTPTDRLRADAATVVMALTEGLRAQVAAISVTSIDHIELALTSGATLMWGSAEDSALKAEAATALLTSVPGASYYDVSAPAYPAARP
ncbi:MAG: FtsQ-type POTRA domain-containing protein [Propionibacteriaceae bacterium]|jgi:cell division protein FtsQ|nr:FtsQ-type POTRA domain-containing protein [Propionibacteriaceae bacterium]